MLPQGDNIMIIISHRLVLKVLLFFYLKRGILLVAVRSGQTHKLILF